MGIAKSIEAYGIFEGYTSDTDIFIQTLSELLDSDFVVSGINIEGGLVIEEQLFEFNKQLRHRLSIEYYAYRIAGKVKLLPCYRLIVPINYIYEEDIEIEFFPNKTCRIGFFTFEHLWVFFIEILRWQRSPYDNFRKEASIRYNQLRNEYWEILKKVGIDQLLIITHAYYKIEGITNIEEFPEMSFEKIIDTAKKLDNFSVFDLNTILQLNSPEQLPDRFRNENVLKIAFIDVL